MAWYDPRDWGDAGKTILNAVAPPTALFDSTRSSAAGKLLGDPGADAERQRRDLLYQQAQRAGDFANVGERGYRQLGREANAQRDYLRRLVSGQDSVSAEQLRQSTQRNLASQLSMAAGAAPQNAAGAARTAAIQMGRINAGMAGQQALAGIQERQAANQTLGSMILQQRGQDQGVALGGRQIATAGYGAQNAGEREKGLIEQYGPAAVGAGQRIAASDERLKTGVRRSDAQANRAIDGLRSYAFGYREEMPTGMATGHRSHGSAVTAPPEPRTLRVPLPSRVDVGVTAQDLERAGLGNAVINTPAGKMVDGGQLATSSAAMIGALGRRVRRLERGK